MLERILASKTKIKILRKLIEKPEREYSFEDIAKLTALSFGTVHPALKDLVYSRAVEMRKIGKSKLYRINQRHILFKELKALFISESNSFVQIAKKFAAKLDKRNIKIIILFGSVARGEFTEKSDIDVLFIYKFAEAPIRKRISKLSQSFLDKWDVEIAPLYLSTKEAKQRVKRFDRFMVRILDEGKILYGDIKWLER